MRILTVCVSLAVAPISWAAPAGDKPDVPKAPSDQVESGVQADFFSRVKRIQQLHARCMELASSDRLTEVAKLVQELKWTAEGIQDGKGMDAVSAIVPDVEKISTRLHNIAGDLEKAGENDSWRNPFMHESFVDLVERLKACLPVAVETPWEEADSNAPPATFTGAVHRLNDVSNRLAEILKDRNPPSLRVYAQQMKVVGDNLGRLIERDVVVPLRATSGKATDEIRTLADDLLTAVRQGDSDAAKRALTALGKPISVLAKLPRQAPLLEWGVGGEDGRVSAMFVRRTVRREDFLARGGGSAATEAAVLRGLRWLARHQNADGSWDADGFKANCNKMLLGICDGPGYAEYKTGVTGLALLAFLGAGYNHISRDVYDDISFGQVVKNGLKWLMANQDKDGCLGGKSSSKYLYNHAIATLAMSEAYGMTGAQLLKEPAQKGINFLVFAQNLFKGWRYTARCGDNDTSVTGWSVMALRSAEISGLAFPRSAYKGARAWLDEVTGTDSRVGYNAKGTGQVVTEGKNEQYANHEALAAVGMMVRIIADKNRSDPQLEWTAQLLVKDLPVWDANKLDYYYWYYASLALFQFDGPGGKYWKLWNKNMMDALVPNQKTDRDGCWSGSWEAKDRWGFEGGRVYATAINVLTLEVYYRYEIMLSGPASPKGPGPTGEKDSGKPAVCWACKGNGVCAGCSGIGVVRETIVTGGPGGSSSEKDATCPVCKGSGKCQLCGDSGRATR
jgi:hypothetical protein